MAVNWRNRSKLNHLKSYNTKRNPHYCKDCKYYQKSIALNGEYCRLTATEITALLTCKNFEQGDSQNER